MESRIIDLIEEQILVGFTGKLNVLSSYNRQYLGHILFKNGELIQVHFNKKTGLKAFYLLLINESSLKKYDLILEPELVDEKERQIHLSFLDMKKNLSDVLVKHSESLKFRPPENIKILIDPEIIEDSLPITPEEFEVLKALTEWSHPKDLYEYCPLLEHEITMALVSLRKKEGLKIIAQKI